MKDSSRLSNEVQSIVVAYCDRCARRSSKLLCDDLSLQELCEDCFDILTRWRAIRPLLSS
jgi:hypothetical protein